MTENPSVREWREPCSTKNGAKLLANYNPPDLPYHSTGRYTDGRAFTPPQQEIIDAALTIVAKNQKRFDVGLAAWAIMPNHPHIFAFDRDTKRPSQVWRFRQQVHAQLARWLQDNWGIDDPVFAQDLVSQLIPIVDCNRTAETVAYIEANHVKAGIVANPADLPPGAVSLRSMMFEPLVIKRPQKWFRPNKWPEYATIQLEMPPQVAEIYTERQWHHKTSMALFNRCYGHNKDRNEAGVGLVGLEKTQNRTPEEPGKKIRNKKRVLFAGSDKRLLAIHYLKHRRFQRGIRRAMDRVRKGMHDTVFPFGTCRMAASFGYKMYIPPG